MNPQDPLAALHPLREPAAIGWWPPAPGWWVLLGLLLAALCVMGYVLLRRHRATAYRRQALKQLQQIRQQCKSNSAQETAQAVNALLKAVALQVYPRQDIAALSGRTWLEFLQRTATADTAFPVAFIDAGYRPDDTSLDLDQLFRAARGWIKTHRGDA